MYHTLTSIIVLYSAGITAAIAVQKPVVLLLLIKR